MKANRAKDRLWEVRRHLQNRCFFFLNSTSSQCCESEAFDGFTLVMFSFSYFNKKRSELVVKTCFFDTSIFLNIKVGDLCNIVVFFTACEWRLKGVKITKQNWYSLNTWGTVNSLRGREKNKKKSCQIFFPAILQIGLMFLRYHMAYFWVHSRAILLYLWGKTNKDISITF